MEDTWNLMGHALRKTLGVIAAMQGWGQAAGLAIAADQAGVPQLAAASLKAALDLDWGDPAARDEALAQVLGLLDRVGGFIAGAAGSDAARACPQVAHQVRDQDVDLSGPVPSLRRGVAKDRRINVEDPEMRQRQQTPAGRAKLRERVKVEHALAHAGHWQVRRARYRGTRKNPSEWRLPTDGQRARRAGRRSSGNDRVRDLPRSASCPKGPFATTCRLR
ncbi:MAG: hypothetical protein ACM3ML_39420 [Micromonosporaceae bacterium]